MDDLDDLIDMLADHCFRLHADAVTWQERARWSYVDSTDRCTCRNAGLAQRIAHNANAMMQRRVREWLVLERHVARLRQMRAERAGAAADRGIA